MFMNSQKVPLEVSRDFWAESAAHDRKQFLSSFVIAATGIVLVGVGIKTALDSDIAGGFLAIGVGSGIV